MSAPHWKSYNVSQSGVDDLVLLPKLNQEAIAGNLNKRYNADQIFTYIGPVLISVNPFKQLPYFTDKEIELYQGANLYENPPHIYAVADHMYRNLTIDNESQCVIISGESGTGAGKTVCAKFVMNYISRVSGGGPAVDQVKQIILASNPLLEAFGNAKTLRNNNSSRFGKYMEISFTGGQPVGGRVNQFLLEKSRVVSAGPGERNFHIFYQLVKGERSPEQRRSFGLTGFDCHDFAILARTGEYDADDMNDEQEYRATLESMRQMDMKEEEIDAVLAIVAAILHLGNVQFGEDDREVGAVLDENALAFPAFLLGFDAGELHHKLLTHRMETRWGKSTEVINVEHSKIKAEYTRDSLAKAVYHQLFKYLVEKINAAIPASTQLNLGVLDIYGFEIFRQNGFEQFCINYVNEKLQQIFIELTLKAEQEEYRKEGIQWQEIEFVNNIGLCKLIEAKRPPGIISICDDVTKQTSNKTEGVADTLMQKLEAGIDQEGRQHYENRGKLFLIRHYAGAVNYDADGFVEKNRDQVFVDLLEMCKKSTNPFIQQLFRSIDPAKKQSTQGSIIRDQANNLCDTLMKCQPHYIRTIKPNESKKPHDWQDKKVMHQIQYLGLVENVRVRRAGFAYRRPFEKFLQRYSILTPETFRDWSPFNRGGHRGQPQEAIQRIMGQVNMERSEWQLGHTKVFIKAPESLFLLEEVRERKYNVFARLIQKTWRKYAARRKTNTQATEAARLLAGRKQRCRASVSRQFVGDYLGMDQDERAGLTKHLGRRERVLFALQVTKFNRKFAPTNRELVVTDGKIRLFGYRPSIPEKEAKKMHPTQIPYEAFVDVLINYEQLEKIELSRLQDGFLLIRYRDDQPVTNPILLECTLKTELLWALDKTMAKKFKKALPLAFVDQMVYQVEPKGFLQTKGLKKTAPRTVVFQEGGSGLQIDTKSKKYTMAITVATGAPARVMPATVEVRPKQQQQQQQQGWLRPHQPQQHDTSYLEADPGFPTPPTNMIHHQQQQQHQQRPQFRPPPQQQQHRPQFQPQQQQQQQQHHRPQEQRSQRPQQQPPFQPQFRLPGTRHHHQHQSHHHHQGHQGRIPPSNQPQYARQNNKIGNRNHNFQSNQFRHHQNGQNQPSITRNRLPSGRDESAPSPYRDQNIRNVANVLNTKFQQPQQQFDELPALPTQVAEMSIRHQPSQRPQMPPKPRPAPKPKQMPKARVLYDYQASDNDEITLAEGEQVEILKEDPNGWFMVRKGATSGLFPGNYLEKM